jgi:hypothetical protein
MAETASIKSSNSASYLLIAFTRSEMICTLFLVTFANANIRIAATDITQFGFFASAPQGFGVNWVIWFAFAVCLSLLVKAAPAPATRVDWIVGLACSLLIIWPTAYLSMVAITFLGIYAIMFHPKDRYLLASGIVMLAIAVNGLWTNFALLFVSTYVLAFDTFLVGLLTGSAYAGNVITAGEDFNLVVGIPCSFVGNASLALVLWIAITRSFRVEPIRQEIAYAAAVFGGVIVINTVRISYMTIDPSWLTFMHVGLGAQIISVAILLFTFVVSMFGVRREIAR